MVGDLTLADEVLGAGKLVGKNRCDKIFGIHPRELWRHSLAAAEAWQRQRDAGDPTPTRDEHRGVEQCLDQNRPDAGRMQIVPYLIEIEAVRLGQRQYDIVLSCRGLQLEIELAANSLAQSEPPGTVDAAAVGRVDDELH